MDFRYLIVIVYIATAISIVSSSGTLRVRRGFGGGGHAGLSNLGGYAPGYGSGPAGQAAGYAALQEIRNNQNIAFWAANIAVASAVANDYHNQQSTTSQFVHQFIVPVTKSQNHGGGKDGHNRGGHSGGGHSGGSHPGRGHGGGFTPNRHGGMKDRGQWKPLYGQRGQTQKRHHGTGRNGNEIHEGNSRNDFNGHENPHGQEIQHDPQHLQYLEHRHHHEHHHDHGHRREPEFHRGPPEHQHDHDFQHHPEHRHEVEECHRHK